MSARILMGDCRDMLATLPDAGVQCCVTSPPYANLRDYGHPDQIGAEATAEEYISELVNVFRQVRRVLRDDGTLWLNLGDGMAEKQLRMIPARVALALQADGWWLRSDIIWAKLNPMPESVTDRPTSAHEHVFLLSKRSSYFYDADAVAEPAETFGRQGSNRTQSDKNIAGVASGVRKGVPGDTYESSTRNLRNVWTIATQPYTGAHFAVMASELAERCIKAGTSERGQCPHCAAPWARVVEKPDFSQQPKRATSKDAHLRNGDRTSAGQAWQEWRNANPDKMLGWSPTCTCPEHTPIPQTVLDPFGGAGTTGLVADRLGRNAVLIELNPQYADLARERLRGDCPMFAEVA